jgi:methylmalonyl-CoA mutase cobalamin-binding subunit
VASPHITVNVHSVAATSAATENVNRHIVERMRERHRDARLHATGGVFGRPDLTRLRRDTHLRRCIHRFACWLLRY